MCSRESLCEPSISLLSDGRWWQATLQKYKGQLLGLLSREEILSLESGKTKYCPLTSCVLCHTCTCTSNRNTCTHKHTHSQVSGKKTNTSCLEVVFRSGVFKRKSESNEPIRMVSSSWHPWLYNKTENIYCLSIWYLCLRLSYLICLQDYEPQKPFSFLSYQDIGILKMDQDNISWKFGKAKRKCLWCATLLQKTINTTEQLGLVALLCFP